MGKRVIFQGVIICFIASLLVGYQFMVQITPGLMVESLQKGLGISLTQTGLLSSTMFYSYLILQGPSGPVAQRLGVRNSLLIASAGIAFTCLLMSFSSSYSMALVARFLAGIFAAPCVVSCFILGYNWLPERWFALLCGLVEISGMLGAATGPVMVSDILENHGWQYALRLIAMVGAGLFLLVFFVVKNRPDTRGEDFSPQAELSDGRHLLTSLGCLIKTPCFISFCLYGSFIFAILNSFSGLWLVHFASKIYHKSEASMTILVTATFVGTICGILLTSILVSYLSHRKIMIFSAAGCLILLSVIIFIHLPFVQMLFCVFLLGAFASVYILPFPLIKACAPRHLTGLALGITNGALILSGVVFQPLLGWLISVRGDTIASLTDYRIAFTPLIVAVALALILSFRISSPEGNGKMLSP